MSQHAIPTVTTSADLLLSADSTSQRLPPTVTGSSKSTEQRQIPSTCSKIMPSTTPSSLIRFCGWSMMGTRVQEGWRKCWTFSASCVMRKSKELIEPFAVGSSDSCGLREAGISFFARSGLLSDSWVDITVSATHAPTHRTQLTRIVYSLPLR